MAALEAVGADPFTSTQAVQEGAALDISPRHTLTLLNRLAEGDWLTRIKKGLYAVNDPVTKSPKAHPFAIGTALVMPAAVSHWSALQHWGLTEQISATITLSSPKRTFPPSNGARDPKARRAWVVAGVRYEVVAITKPRFFGLTKIWVNERDQVAIFERERALLDAFQHFHIFGSISVGLEILENHLVDLELSLLVRYAQQLQVAAVTKRIGWALEKLHVPLDRLEPLLSYPAKGDIPLDPGRPPHGRHNPTWHVIENLDAR
jgi:predicted transcriptional regulator of viral defense system